MPLVSEDARVIAELLAHQSPAVRDAIAPARTALLNAMRALEREERARQYDRDHGP